VILRWDLETQEKVDNGLICSNPDGIYVLEEFETERTEENFPRELGFRLVEEFKRSGTLDWRIVYGEDEKEDPVTWQGYPGGASESHPTGRTVHMG
jgi:hypothetical protein